MKSNLKGLAYGFAVNLVKAEYREQVSWSLTQIPKNFKERIENLARRPTK